MFRRRNSGEDTPVPTNPPEEWIMDRSVPGWTRAETVGLGGRAVRYWVHREEVPQTANVTVRYPDGSVKVVLEIPYAQQPTQEDVQND